MKKIAFSINGAEVQLIETNSLFELRTKLDIPDNYSVRVNGNSLFDVDLKSGDFVSFNEPTAKAHSNNCPHCNKSIGILVTK